MKNGIILIPDISGYSRFVKDIETEVGAHIIEALLREVIQANRLSLKISEIEGDAILFYRYGNVCSISEILDQSNDMINAFNARKEQLTALYPQVGNLSLKVIAHYGIIEEFSIDGFTKLYGQTVVEAHRLLKNEIGLDSYVLISDAFVDQLEEGWFENHNHDVFNRRCELYSDVGKICYTFFPGTTLAGQKANDLRLQLQ